VLACNRDGAYQIYTMRADGSELRRLTQGPASFTPDWSR
jgi:Tol biopolymer transport system component